VVEAGQAEASSEQKVPMTNRRQFLERALARRPLFRTAVAGAEPAQCNRLHAPAGAAVLQRSRIRRCGQYDFQSHSRSALEASYRVTGGAATSVSGPFDQGEVT
jgi:hypothetical protein